MNTEVNSCLPPPSYVAEMNDAATLPHRLNDSEQNEDYQISNTPCKVEGGEQETTGQRPCRADRIADALATLRRR